MSAAVAVHQFLPTFNPGDAIGNVTRAIRDVLRERGHPSEIFAENVHPDLRDEGHPYGDYPHHRRADDVVLYHFSVASPVSDYVRLLWQRTVLVYHNVTPPHFYEGLEAPVQRVLARSEAELRRLAGAVDLAVGDSGFNCRELERAGYRDPVVLPILLDLSQLDVAPDPAVLGRRSGPGSRILFVGRLAPNKRIEDVMVAFDHYRRTREPGARLAIVGGAFSPLYHRRLRALRDHLGSDAIELTGRVSQAELNAHYRVADAFLCLSDHEGYCVPLVECMHFGVPIVAYRQGGVAWTLGESGHVLERKDPETVAVALEQLLGDPALRQRTVEAQRRRLVDLQPAAVRSRLLAVVEAALALPVRRPRLTFVVQRYGPEVLGGSESLCRSVVEHLAPEADVEVLTTTARDYESWAPAYPAGRARDAAGIEVERFEVRGGRDLAAFSKASERLFARPERSRDEEAAWVHDQGPFCPDLIEAARARAGTRDALFFFTYLYHPTVAGLLAAGERAILVPTSHDEAPFHFPVLQAAMRSARGLVFSTEEEQELTWAALGGPRPLELIVGAGIEGAPADPAAAAERFRRRTGLERPFLIYVGRVSPAKGCEALLDLHARLRAEWPEAPDLVLVGRSEIPLGGRPGVHALGFLEDEAEKFEAIAAAEVLLNPSPMESLSIVLLEAWATGRPTLVNAASPPLVGQSRRAGAGLWYRSYEEFAAMTRLLCGDPALRARMGDSGRRYVRSRYHWSAIVHAYLAAARFVQLSPPGRGRSSGAPGAVPPAGAGPTATTAREARDNAPGENGAAA